MENTPQSHPASVKIVKNQSWDQVTYRRSLAPFLIITIFSEILFVILAAVGLIGLAYIFIQIELMLIFVMLFVIIVLINILMIWYYYKDWTSYTYTLISGEAKIVDETTFDEVPAKVVITHGILSKQVTNLTSTDFSRVEMYQSLFGKIFNYGNVYLEEVSKLTDTQSYRLSAVHDPMDMVKKVQEIIDISANKTQQITTQTK
jgi:hypothetical protein